MVPTTGWAYVGVFGVDDPIGGFDAVANRANRAGGQSVVAFDAARDGLGHRDVRVDDVVAHSHGNPGQRACRRSVHVLDQDCAHAAYRTRGEHQVPGTAPGILRTDVDDVGSDPGHDRAELPHGPEIAPGLDSWQQHGLRAGPGRGEPFGGSGVGDGDRDVDVGTEGTEQRAGRDRGPVLGCTAVPKEETDGPVAEGDVRDVELVSLAAACRRSAFAVYGRRLGRGFPTNRAGLSLNNNC